MLTPANEKATVSSVENANETLFEGFNPNKNCTA